MSENKKILEEAAQRSFNREAEELKKDQVKKTAEDLQVAKVQEIKAMTAAEEKKVKED